MTTMRSGSCSDIPPTEEASAVTVSQSTLSLQSRTPPDLSQSLHPQEVRIPSQLKPGDIVFLVAPSSAITPALLQSNVNILESLGLRVKYRSDIFAQHLSFGGTKERRLSEMLEALNDTEAKAIWAARGGYGATYVLEGLDLDSVRTANKWLIGFSDITVLHAAWRRAGVASIHAATVHYLERWTESARLELISYLTNPATCHVLTGETIRGEKAVDGWLTGGNLTMLASLTGTRYLPDWSGAIVLLEDINEAPYRLDRNLLQLHQAGAFDGVVGIALGQFKDCVDDDPEDTALERVVGVLIAYVDVPILSGLSIGHGYDSRPVAFGVSARLDPVDATLRICLRE